MKGGVVRMNIETDRYQIASLSEQSQALHIIQEAEAKIAEMTGRDVTLIAYSKTGATEQQH
ncbi:hypothetical protein [Paenibacillus cremeus]|uniref:Uncharacterized protein n=1 Tax=Paenibacillus cremeus TaxID=2163881 RepID=A0A559KF94_9BACL|nr:hypothetical protein [Paenibacillus cremeus]TVY10802.1 hypothetical protein FPZ49_06800 [Paenibacillus cremeus]